MNNIEFLKSTKHDQLRFLIEDKLSSFVLDSEYEKAEQLRKFIVKYQSKDFSLDDNSDLQSYMGMLKLVF
jgi:hypothetical protein